MEDSGPSNPNGGSRRISHASQDLEQRVARISEFDAATLQESWEAVFRARPSPNLARSFMIRALAYRIQEKALGALKPSALRILDRVAEDQSALEQPQRASPRRASAGIVLIRQWRGVTHRVTVLDNGVVYRGRHYKSLSEVARLITGTRWSGPLFFGLGNRKRESANG